MPAGGVRAARRRRAPRQRGRTAHDPRGSPSVRVRLDEPVGEREEPDRRRREARQVEPLSWVGSRDSSIRRKLAKMPQDPDGHVDEEDPVPARVLGEQPADERADRERERRDARPDPDRCAPLARRERRGDDRQRRRVHQRRAGTLQDPRSDEHVAAGREAAQQRGEREHHDAHHEDQASAVRVGELAADQHQRREGERIARDDPLELREPDTEIALDRGKRDVHDGVVEHDHEQPERHSRERPPLLVLLRHEPRPHASTSSS